MRIDRVEAHAFGPFTDRALDLQPGLTVVHGPNEAGKSTWHAAIYGGLCGLRHVGAVPVHRARDVLDPALALVEEDRRDAAADRVPHGCRQRYAARFWQRLQPRRQVDAVAVDRAIRLLEHVAKMYAYPKA